jgi:hypothetical protein
METLLAIASSPEKKQTVTMTVILQRTPKPTTEVLQTYYPPGKLFAQASTPTQSPPRRGRYKTIQRGSWKQPRKNFQRKIRNGETTTSKNQHEQQRSTPTVTVLSSRLLTQRQRTKKSPGTSKERHRQNPRHTIAPSQKDQTAPTFPHTTQENLAFGQKLMRILLLTLQHQDTTSASSLGKDINVHHLFDIDHLTQPVQRTGQIEKDRISVKQTNEVFYIVDRAADATQGHSKDHPNEWSIQVTHELLSGTGHLATLQDICSVFV